MGLSTLEQFPWGLLYTVVLYICISYSLILVLIYRYRFENIHLLHTYYIIIVYLQNKVITLFFMYKTLHGMGAAYISDRDNIKNNTRNT